MLLKISEQNGEKFSMLPVHDDNNIRLRRNLGVRAIEVVSATEAQVQRLICLDYTSAAFYF